MAPHLEKGPLDPQLRALALSTLDFCLGRLEKARPEDEDEWASRVHDTRRKLKWQRALLRAVRPSLSSSAFRREDHALRDVGRTLAAARAHVARAAVLRSLSAHFSLPEEHAREALRFLEASTPRGGVKDAIEALSALTAIRARGLDFLPEIEPETLVAGLCDQLRRARKAYRRARRDPTPHLLHEWRKQVKYHLHQLELLRELVPALSERTAAVKALSELLGLAHDVAELRQCLASRKLPQGQGGVDLCALLDAREDELALRALTRGDPLFRGAKPRELRGLLERHVR